MSVEVLKALMGSGKVVGRLAGIFTLGATWFQQEGFRRVVADRSYCEGEALNALRAEAEFGRYSLEITKLVNCAVTNTPDSGEIQRDLTVGIVLALLYNMMGVFKVGKEMFSDGQTNENPSGNTNGPKPFGLPLYFANKFLDASVVGRIGVEAVTTAAIIAMPYALDRVGHMVAESFSYPQMAVELGDPVAALGLVAVGIVGWNALKLGAKIVNRF